MNEKSKDISMNKNIKKMKILFYNNNLLPHDKKNKQDKPI